VPVVVVVLQEGGLVVEAVTVEVEVEGANVDLHHTVQCQEVDPVLKALQGGDVAAVVLGQDLVPDQNDNVTWKTPTQIDCSSE